MFYGKDKDSEVINEFFKIMSKYNEKNVANDIVKVAVTIRLPRWLTVADEAEDLGGLLEEAGVRGGSTIRAALDTISSDGNTLSSRGVSLIGTGQSEDAIVATIEANLTSLRRDAVAAKESLIDLEESDDIVSLIARLDNVIEIIDASRPLAREIAQSRILYDYITQAPGVLIALEAKLDDIARQAGELTIPFSSVTQDQLPATPRMMHRLTGELGAIVKPGSDDLLVNLRNPSQSIWKSAIFDPDELWRLVYGNWRAAVRRASNTGETPPDLNLSYVLDYLKSNDNTILDDLNYNTYGVIIDQPGGLLAAEARYTNYVSDLLEQGGRSIDEAEAFLAGRVGPSVPVEVADELVPDPEATPAVVSPEGPFSGTSPSRHGYNIQDPISPNDLPSGIQTRVSSGFIEASGSDASRVPSSGRATNIVVEASNQEDASKLQSLLDLFDDIGSGGSGAHLLEDGSYLVPGRMFYGIFEVSDDEFIHIRNLEQALEWFEGRSGIWATEGISVDAFDIRNMNPVRITGIDMNAPVNSAVSIEAKLPVGHIWIDPSAAPSQAAYVYDAGDGLRIYSQSQAVDLVRGKVASALSDFNQPPNDPSAFQEWLRVREQYQEAIDALLSREVFTGQGDNWAAELNTVLTSVLGESNTFSPARVDGALVIGQSPSAVSAGTGATHSAPGTGASIPLSATHRLNVGYNDIPLDDLQQGARLASPMMIGVDSARPSGLGPRLDEGPTPVSPAERVVKDEVSQLDTATHEAAEESLRLWRRAVEDAVRTAESEGLSGVEKNLRIRDLLNDVARPTEVAVENQPTGSLWSRFLGVDDSHVTESVRGWGYAMPRTTSEAAEDVADWMRLLRETNPDDFLRVELAIGYAKEAGIMPPGAGRNIADLLFDEGPDAARNRELLDVDIIGFKNDPRTGLLTFTLDDGTVVRVSDSMAESVIVTPLRPSASSSGMSDLSAPRIPRGTAVIDGFGSTDLSGQLRPSTIDGVTSVEYTRGYIVYNTNMMDGMPVNRAGDKWYVIVDDTSIDSLPSDVQVALQSIVDRVSTRPSSIPDASASGLDHYNNPTTLLGDPLSLLANERVLPDGAVVQVTDPRRGGGVTVFYPDDASRSTLFTANQVEVRPALNRGADEPLQAGDDIGEIYDSSIMIERSYSDTGPDGSRQLDTRVVSRPTPIAPGEDAPGEVWSNWRGRYRAKLASLDDALPDAEKDAAMVDWLVENPPPPREGNFPQMRWDEDFGDPDLRVWEEARDAHNQELTDMYGVSDPGSVTSGMAAWTRENPRPSTGADLVPATRWISDLNGDRTVYSESSKLIEYGRLGPDEIDRLNNEVIQTILSPSRGRQGLPEELLYGSSEFGINNPENVPRGLLGSLEESAAKLRAIADGTEPLPEGWRPIDRARARRSARAMEQVIADIRALREGDVRPDDLENVAKFLMPFPGNPSRLADGLDDATREAYEAWLAYRVGMANLKAIAYELLGRKHARAAALIQELNGVYSLDEAERLTRNLSVRQRLSYVPDPAAFDSQGNLRPGMTSASEVLSPSSQRMLDDYREARAAEISRLEEAYEAASDQERVGRTLEQYKADGLLAWHYESGLGKITIQSDGFFYAERLPEELIRYLRERQRLSQELGLLIGPPPNSRSRGATIISELIDDTGMEGSQLQLNLGHSPIMWDWSHARASTPAVMQGEVGQLTVFNNKLDQLFEVIDTNALEYFQSHFLGRWDPTTQRWIPATPGAADNTRFVGLIGEGRGSINPANPWAMWRRLPDADVHFRRLFNAYVDEIKQQARISVPSMSGGSTGTSWLSDAFMGSLSWLRSQGRWGGPALAGILDAAGVVTRKTHDLIVYDITGVFRRPTGTFGADGKPLLEARKGAMGVMTQHGLFPLPGPKGSRLTGGTLGILHYPGYIGGALLTSHLACWIYNWSQTDGESDVGNFIEDAANKVESATGQTEGPPDPTESPAEDGFISIAQDIADLRQMEEEGVSTGYGAEDCLWTQATSTEIFDFFLGLVPGFILMHDDSRIEECIRSFFDTRYVRSLMRGSDINEIAGWWESTDWYFLGARESMSDRPEGVQEGIRRVRSVINRVGNKSIAKSIDWTKESARANREALVDEILEKLWPDSHSGNPNEVLFPTNLVNSQGAVTQPAEMSPWAPWNATELDGGSGPNNYTTNAVGARSQVEVYRTGLRNLINQMLGCMCLAGLRTVHHRYNIPAVIGVPSAPEEESGGQAAAGTGSTDGQTQQEAILETADEHEEAAEVIIPTTEAEVQRERDLQETVDPTLTFPEAGCFDPVAISGTDCWTCNYGSGPEQECP